MGRGMPRARRAMTNGDISSLAVGVLASAREAHPDEFPGHEATLVEAARTLTAGQLKHAVAYWAQALDFRGAARDAERDRERRRLHVSATLGGMVRVDGDLDPETGETLITALRAVLDTWSRAPTAEDPFPRAAPGGRAGRDLPTVAGPARPARGGRGTPPRDGDGRRRRPGGPARRPEPVRPHRSDPPGRGPPAGLRRLHRPDHLARPIRAARRGAADSGRAGGASAGGGVPRPKLSIPRLRSAPRVVRRPPRAALGRRRSHRPVQPPPPVPAPPPTGPRRRIRGPRDRRIAPIHQAGRVAARRPRATLMEPPRGPGRPC